MLELEQIIIVLAVAFAVTYAMVPVSKKIAHLIGAIDYPSNRRINNEPVPRCGGIALYCGFAAGCAAAFIGIRFFGWSGGELYTLPYINYRALFVGVTFMFTVGLVDDIMQISARTKLIGQIVAACIVAGAGVSISAVRAITGDYIELGILDFPVTVFYLVVFVNLVNLIDGLDGLAAGISAIAAVGFLILTASRGSFLLPMLCIAIIGACLAFLRFNFHPASIFMGDSGALFLGLILGIVSLLGVVRAQSMVMGLVPLIIAGVPLLDTLSAIVRRAHEHKPIGQADTGHVHHRLLRFGMSQRKAVLILYACAAGLMICGLALNGVPESFQWIIVVGLIILGSVVVWKLGFAQPVLRHYYEGKGKIGPRKPRFIAAQKVSEESAAPSEETVSQTPEEGGEQHG